MEKPTRYYSNKQEKRASKTLGVHQQVNSGATMFKKGDLIDKHMLLDAKTMVKPQKSVSLKKEWFTKISEEMFAMGRRFCGILFDFGDGKDYVAVPVQDFNELYNAWKELNNED